MLGQEYTRFETLLKISNSELENTTIASMKNEMDIKKTPTSNGITTHRNNKISTFHHIQKSYLMGSRT